MGEKISKGIFWAISFILLGEFIYYVRGINAQNFINVLSLLLLVIITNPYIVDKISKKVGAKAADYSYACKMLLIFSGILIAFMISTIIFLCTSNEIDESVAIQNFEAILEIAVYIVYLVILFIFKSGDKVFRYIVFGIFYFICVILTFTSQSINENIIVILNYLPEGHLDVSSFETLINDFLIPVKEAILTYIIFDTIIENQNHKTETNDLKEEKDIKEHKSNNNAIHYDVNVIDKETNDSKNKKICIYKK